MPKELKKNYFTNKLILVIQKKVSARDCTCFFQTVPDRTL